MSLAINTNNLLFMQGCAGDINPVDVPSITSDTLSKNFADLPLTSLNGINGNIVTKLDSIKIPIVKFTEAEANQVIDDYSGSLNVYDQMEVRWANLLLQKYHDDTMPDDMTVYIQIVKIGDWSIVGLSREAVSDYALDLYDLYPTQKITVLGYSNDVSSYLPVAWHMEQDTYEGGISFLMYGQSGLPVYGVKDLIINKVLSMM